MPACTTTNAQNALVRKAFPGGDHPFTIVNSLDNEQKTAARTWIDRDAAEGLVDENEGGIIAYVDAGCIDRIVGLLNAAVAQARAEQAAQANPWRDDQTQFARLLGEIGQLGIIPKGKAMRTLCDSMGLHPQEIHELFDRASDAWDRRKAETRDATGPTTAPTRVPSQDRQEALRACVDDLCDGDHGQAECRLVGEWVRDLIRDNPEDDCTSGLLLASLDELMAAIATVRASVAASAPAA